MNPMRPTDLEPTAAELENSLKAKNCAWRRSLKFPSAATKRI